MMLYLFLSGDFLHPSPLKIHIVMNVLVVIVTVVVFVQKTLFYIFWKMLNVLCRIKIVSNFHAYFSESFVLSYFKYYTWNWLAEAEAHAPLPVAWNV